MPWAPDDDCHGTCAPFAPPVAKVPSVRSRPTRGSDIACRTLATKPAGDAERGGDMRGLSSTKRLALLLCAAAVAIVGAPSAAHASPVLTITPLTWNVVGLDSNAPSSGPDLFPVGARVCNTGDASATAGSAQLAWDSSNTFINVDGSSTISLGDVA